ncbi:MAG: hypothetical protein GX126_02625 [Bacteroidales bacterium]|nr:hypothetical protein [Bacteroidales bacterium]
MKSRLIILSMVALFTGACTSGSYITRNYPDDIYFNPGDVPPPIILEEEPVAQETVMEKSANRMIISNIEENQEGSQTMSNYIFDGSEEDADALTYSIDQFDRYDSDTSVYYNDDEVKYVINNYYDGDEMDYAYRIRRFHRPYFYDPFYWDSWYYDPFYYDPFYYSSWYSPYWSYSWGWGHSWYSPYSSWGWGYSPYYSYWHRPYYGGYYGGGYPYYGWYGSGGRYYADSENYRYGKRDEGNTNVYYGSDSGRRTSTSAARTTAVVPKSGRTGTGESATTQPGRRTTTSGTVNTRQVSQDRNSNVLTEGRRTTSSVSGDQSVKRGTTTSARTYTRPGSTTGTRTYTRPYTGTSATPRVVNPKSSSTTRYYRQPSSSSTYNRSYRTNSTYNRSSGTRSSGGTYRKPSSSSTKSGSVYQRSTPSRSSSSGSYRSSGGSSSRGSYSTGSSGSSRSSSSSSSSGRRR